MYAKYNIQINLKIAYQHIMTPMNAFSQATILSSHRSFVIKADVVELSDELCGRNLPLSLFLFTDTLEVCSTPVAIFRSTVYIQVTCCDPFSSSILC